MIKFLPLTGRPWGHLIVDNWYSLYNAKLTNDKRHCNWSCGNKLKFLQVESLEKCRFVWLELLLLPLSGSMLCCSWSLCRCFWPVLLQREGYRNHACWTLRAVLNQPTPCWPWNIWPCPSLDTATGEQGLALRRDGLTCYHRCWRIDQWHGTRRAGLSEWGGPSVLKISAITRPSFWALDWPTLSSTLSKTCWNLWGIGSVKL